MEYLIRYAGCTLIVAHSLRWETVYDEQTELQATHLVNVRPKQHFQSRVHHITVSRSQHNINSTSPVSLLNTSHRGLCHSSSKK